MNRVFIEDCNWHGWCREECPLKRIQVTVSYNEYGIPVTRFCEPHPMNKNCISMSFEKLDEVSRKPYMKG